MFKLAPSFEKAIRRLKSPTSIDYDAAAWRAALAGAKDAGLVERRLVATGEWIAAHASLGRSTLKTPELDQLDGEWRTVLAIAMLNREYRAADAMVREQLKAAADEGKTAILDEMGAMRVMGGAGQPLAVADLNEASVEAVESWLYDALNAPGSGTASGNLTTAAVRGVQAYGWRKALNSLWNEARYLGAYVLTSGDRMYWLPDDADLEKLISACRERQEMNLLGFPTIDRRQWPLIPKARRKQLGMVRSVTLASRKDGVAALRVEALHYLSSRPPEYVGEKGSLEGSYLAEFLTLAMPSHPRLSPLLVLQAWHVVRDAAEALTRVTPQPVRLDATTALESALAVSRPILTGAIATALAVDATVAGTLVEFLTYRISTGASKGHKGLWAAPLVPVPGTDLFALPLNPLVTSNPLRRLEAWLERGGIDDSNPVDQRGERYEASYRRSLCAAVDGNPAFQTARCAPDGVKRNVVFDEQVDLLVSIGDLALVGELKFFLTPADPHERARYFDRLESAGEQAVRKAAALDARRDVVAARARHYRGAGAAIDAQADSGDEPGVRILSGGGRRDRDRRGLPAHLPRRRRDDQRHGDVREDECGGADPSSVLLHRDGGPEAVRRRDGCALRADEVPGQDAVANLDHADANRAGAGDRCALRRTFGGLRA